MAEKAQNPFPNDADRAEGAHQELANELEDTRKTGELYMDVFVKFLGFQTSEE